MDQRNSFRVEGSQNLAFHHKISTADDLTMKETPQSLKTRINNSIALLMGFFREFRVPIYLYAFDVE